MAKLQSLTGKPLEKLALARVPRWRWLARRRIRQLLEGKTLVMTTRPIEYRDGAAIMTVDAHLV